MLNQRFSFPLAMAMAVAACSSGSIVGAQQTQPAAAGGQATPSASQTAPGATPNATQAPAPDLNQTDQEVDPLKRKLSDREAYKRQKDYHEEIKGAYKSWLNNDVHWIITDEEAKTFKSLSNDEEREAFIEQFWLRRNPNPDSPENEFREEHYRRIAYANEHFPAGKPGWKTDRGHMYISFGKPDNIDSHPSGGSYDRPMDEGGGETSTFPFEVWHYRYIEGVGDNIDIEFVDTCMCGDYHMTIDRSEKDALLHVPGAGATMAEQQGRSTKADRFKGGTESLGAGPMTATNQNKQFDRIELLAKLQAPPPIKFKDLQLESFMTKSKLITGPIFPFDVRMDYVKVTDDTVLVPITLQIRNRDITFETKDGVAKGVVDIIGRVSTITGKIAQTFEDSVFVEVPADLLDKTMDNQSVYWKALPLRPGRYRVDIGIKDVNNPDHVGIFGQGVMVPKYDEEKLAASSLILADKMEAVPTKQIGSGSFIIGNTYVRPRVSANAATPVTIHHDQRLNFWMQVYNLGIDDKLRTNSATIDYQITDATDKMVFEKQENSKALGANSDQMTLEKSWSVAQLTPGRYKVTIKINDSISKQEIAQSVPFNVD